MLDILLFVVLPYLALTACIFGSIYRIRKQGLTYTALSSQFLESKALVWGSVPWHIGIILILLAHIIVLVAPGPWKAAMSVQPVLQAVEISGIALSVGCIVGLLVLIVRRIMSSRLQAVSTTMDFVVLLLLLVQVATGLGMALHYKWGAAWAPGSMTPYIWSLFTFNPNIAVIQDMPILVRAHIVGAWLIILVIPFSRLIHMFAVPIEYLFRPPQKVVWTNERRAEAAREHYVEEEARRHFLRAGIGIAAGGALLAVGALDKTWRFFFGPRLSKEEEGEMMELRLKRLQATAEQRKLELERQQSNYILIAKLSELNGTKGKYFTDYSMQPAMAFKDKDGLPILLSAKCTHLGCTVGNDVNAKGQILCPCHVSFFDIETGKPNEGAPAKLPLPLLGWVLMDTKGTVLLERNRAGKITGERNASALAEANVYIARAHAEAVS